MGPYDGARRADGFPSVQAVIRQGSPLNGKRILVVDDEPSVAEAMSRALRGFGCEVEVAHSIEVATAIAGRMEFDAAVVDIFLDERPCRDLVRYLKARAFAPTIMVLSGMASVDLAVELMSEGADDFLEKPLSPSLLASRLILSLARTAARRAALPEGGSGKGASSPFWRSASMAPVIDLAERVARTPSSSALLVGESGVGKEVIASYIHAASHRRDGPMVCVNVAAIPQGMIEVDLFGSLKGAYTDAKQPRQGHLASADGGTLLLDEIGELGLDCQPKLLRVLEARTFFPVGSDKERSVDVRILAATNRDPDEMLARGFVRRDLFFRLGVVIRIPPLRERAEEIGPLAAYFVQHFCSEFGRAVLPLTPAAVALLTRHEWTGNVRELRNIIERAVMLSDGDAIEADAIVLSDPRSPTTGLPSASMKTASDHSLNGVRAQATEHAEREHIVDALRRAQGSRSRAAQILGVSRSTLYEKLKRYGIE